MEKIIRKSKLFTWAKNWMNQCYGKSSLNPQPVIKRKLEEGIKVLMIDLETAKDPEKVKVKKMAIEGFTLRLKALTGEGSLPYPLHEGH